MKGQILQTPLFNMIAVIMLIILMLVIVYKEKSMSEYMYLDEVQSTLHTYARAYFSSPDCLAYSVSRLKFIKVGSYDIPLYGRRVYPFVVDLNKIKSLPNQNCYNNYYTKDNTLLYYVKRSVVLSGDRYIKAGTRYEESMSLPECEPMYSFDTFVRVTDGYSNDIRHINYTSCVIYGIKGEGQ